MSKKNIVIAIEGEEPKYLVVDQINIIYNGMDSVDMAILITPASVTDQESPIGKPSSRGIEMGAKFSGPALVKDIPEVKAKLDELRIMKLVTVIPADSDLKLYKVVIPDRKMFTQYYPWNTLNGPLLALKELVALEKNLMGSLDNVIFVVGYEEFVFTEDGSKFKAQETVRVYERVAIPEDVPTIKAEGKQDMTTSSKPELSSEDTELWDIFKELFKKNPARIQAIIENTGKADEATSFFVGQAVLATGSKIPQKKIEDMLVAVAATFADLLS